MSGYPESLTQHYGVIGIAALFFIIFLFTGHSIGSTLRRSFLRGTILVILLVIADSVTHYLGTFPEPNQWRVFSAAAAYTLRVSILYNFLTQYSRRLSLRIRAWLSIPLFATLIAAFSAFITPLSFSYTENNKISRGPLILVPFVASFFYFAAILFLGRKSIRLKDYREITTVGIIFVFAALTTFAEVKLNYEGLLPGLCMIGIIFYYLFFLTDNYTHDPLSGAGTRAKLYYDFDHLKRAPSVISIDLNDLKKLNDTKGHAEGDKAISTVSNAMLSAIPKNARLYRVGGDEFLILLHTADEEELRICQNDVAAAVRNTPYTIAIGGVVPEDTETLESLMSRADALMYQDKKAKKDTMEKESTKE